MECENHQLSFITAGLLDPQPVDECKNHSELNANNIHSCDCNSITVPQTKYLPSTYKSSLISTERLNELRRKVQEAIRQHKVFTVRGCYHTVRKSLTERGWVEKSEWYKVKNYGTGNGGGGCYLLEDFIQHLPPRRPGETKLTHIAKCERNIMSRFLEHSSIDLLWTARREKSDISDVTKNQTLIVNRFCKAPFTSKEGICSALKDFHWYYEDGINFPRCYNVWNPEELNDFVENFRLTSCIGLLRWLVEHGGNNGFEKVVCSDGRVPSTCFQFAHLRVKEFLDSCLHNDIDMEDETDDKIWEHDWDVFLTHHYMVTHESSTVKIQRSVTLESLLPSAKNLLEQIKTHWPQYGLDGYLNIWIVKPGNKCRGRGIHLMNNIKQIMQMVNPSIVTKARFVVQKYIERPLIIHNTKFDIRQWFLLTSIHPLQIWFYKESYLRFSSQNYNLLNYHESVHLTNYAIQKKYSNETSRDSRLPTENMWDCLSFQAYLRQIGKSELWFERIYPGMQKAIIGTMLACQDSMDHQKNTNTFELYGADFMIDEDFCPWLIEINSSPDLAPSTSVTARMCPQCIEDTLKVVVDRKMDPNADTGSFEMIYKQVIPKTPAYMGLNLAVRGYRIKNTNPEPTSLKREKAKPLSTKTLQSAIHLSTSCRLTKNKFKETAPSVIMDLIDCLNMKSKFVSGPSGTRITAKTAKPARKVQEQPKKEEPPPKPLMNATQQIIKSTLLKKAVRKNEEGEIELIDMKKEYSKRHASCGPKFHFEGAVPKLTLSSDPSEMKCIGNKLTDTTIDIHNSLTPPSTSSPHSKKCRSLEDTPAMKKSPAKAGNSVQKLGNRNHVVHNNNTKLYIQAAANPQNTNMFAVGSSLRTWRSKYSSMLKIEKENFPDSIKTYKYFRSAAGPMCSPIKIKSTARVKHVE